MFMSNVVEKSIQTNKNGESSGHVQIKQATNSLTSVPQSKWARSANSPASLLSTFRYPWKNRAPPSDSLSRPGPLSSTSRILTHRYDTFADCGAFDLWDR